MKFFPLPEILKWITIIPFKYFPFSFVAFYCNNQVVFTFYYHLENDMDQNLKNKKKFSLWQDLNMNTTSLNQSSVITYNWTTERSAIWLIMNDTWWWACMTESQSKILIRGNYCWFSVDFYMMHCILLSWKVIWITTAMHLTGSLLHGTDWRCAYLQVLGFT